jgi:hypothetical protein
MTVEFSSKPKKLSLREAHKQSRRKLSEFREAFSAIADFFLNDDREAQKKSATDFGNVRLRA